MKKTLLACCLLLATLSACDRSSSEPMPRNTSDQYSVYRPVLMDKAQLKNSISFQDARNLNNTGKIYTKDNYLFISERYKGVHVIDNSNPSAPANTGFIRVPGCLDMAVKGTILYVDNATDLVSIDISDPKHPFVVNRITDIFPSLESPDGRNLQNEYSEAKRPENTIIVDWVRIN